MYLLENRGGQTVGYGCLGQQWMEQEYPPPYTGMICPEEAGQEEADREVYCPWS